MTGTTAKAHLVDLLLEPLRGCTGLYTYRQELIQQVMRMPALEVKERLEHLFLILAKRLNAYMIHTSWFGSLRVTCGTYVHVCASY